MSISDKEKEEIILAAVERALLLIPEVCGNLMAQNAAHAKINREFYSKYSEFKDHKKSVVSVIEQTEGAYPLLSYDKILEKAVPEIRKRIGTLKKLDVDTVSPNPNRQYEPLNTPKIDSNGII